MSWYIGSVLFWLVYFPLTQVLGLILLIVPKVRERRAFEMKNATDPGVRSFHHDKVSADLCFEFSSEGEYQQVASLIDDSLKLGKKLELVFFSPSVEKTIVELQRKYPQQIRYLRFPIFLPLFSSWITARTLILVRYDFFLDFLLWSLKPENKLKVIWMSFKKDRLQGKGISFFKKLFLKQSSYTLFASQPDAQLAHESGFKGDAYDFRMEQIKRRVENREAKFKTLFTNYPSLENKLQSYSRHKRLIVGNAWPVDVELLENLPQDVMLVVVPHQLKPEIIQQMKETLERFGRSPQVVSDENISSHTVILNKKGVLCELYADFGKAYVGGGFGVSVHSILEPLVAGSEHIACGPVNHRSTEFDVAMSFGQMKQVGNSQDFRQWLNQNISLMGSHDKLQAEIRSYANYQKEVLSC